MQPPADEFAETNKAIFCHVLRLRKEEETNLVSALVVNGLGFFGRADPKQKLLVDAFQENPMQAVSVIREMSARGLTGAEEKFEFISSLAQFSVAATEAFSHVLPGGSNPSHEMLLERFAQVDAQQDQDQSGVYLFWVFLGTSHDIIADQYGPEFLERFKQDLQQALDDVEASPLSDPRRAKGEVDLLNAMIRGGGEAQIGITAKSFRDRLSKYWFAQSQGSVAESTSKFLLRQHKAGSGKANHRLAIRLVMFLGRERSGDSHITLERAFDWLSDSDFLFIRDTLPKCWAFFKVLSGDFKEESVPRTSLELAECAFQSAFAWFLKDSTLPVSTVYMELVFQNRNVFAPAQSGSDYKGKWTEEEDRILQEGHRELGFKWDKIAGLLFDRTPLACQNRWYNHLVQIRAEKPRWTEEEDRILQEGHRELGFKWDKIAGIRAEKPRWTEEEDRIIREGRELGFKWDKIAGLLPDRTPLACQNRWSVHGGDADEGDGAAAAADDDAAADAADAAAAAAKDESSAGGDAGGAIQGEEADDGDDAGGAAAESGSGEKGDDDSAPADAEAAAANGDGQEEGGEAATDASGNDKDTPSGDAEQGAKALDPVPTELAVDIQIHSGRKRWTEEEDRIIGEGRELGLNWDRIAGFLPDRTLLACKQRWSVHVSWIEFDEDTPSASTVGEWRTALHPDGRTYYWHFATRETTWIKPEWRTALHPDGRTYYWHSVTRETTFIKPDGFTLKRKSSEKKSKEEQEVEEEQKIEEVQEELDVQEETDQGGPAKKAK